MVGRNLERVEVLVDGDDGRERIDRGEMREAGFDQCAGEGERVVGLEV